MKRLTLTAVTCFVALLLAQSVEGALALRLTNNISVGNTKSVTIYDNNSPNEGIDQNGQPLLDANILAGVVHFSGSVGNWDVNISSGLGYPAQDLGALHLNSVNCDFGFANSVPPGDLTIELTLTDQTTPFPGWLMDFGGTLSGPSGTNVFASAYQSNGNGEFDKETLIGELGAYGTGGFSGSVGTSVDTVDPYSLTIVMQIKTNPSSVGKTITYSGDVQLSPLPEPTTLAMWSLIGGLGAVAGWRRTRRKV